MKDATRLLTVEGCLDERIREETEMQRIAGDMSRRAARWMN